MVDQLLGTLFAALGPDSSQHRHESLAECAFAEHTTKQVGNAKRDVEGVGEGTDTEHRCHQQVANEAGHPRGERQE